MNITDEELMEMQRDGARVRNRPPGAAPAPKEAPKPSEGAEIVSAIKGLSSSIGSLASRPAPDVNVSAPQVSVTPKINVEAKATPRKWKVEVTERDTTHDHRIKSLTIEAVD